MSEQDRTGSSTQQRPTTSSPKAWKAYWEKLGQPWRTEPEITLKRQAELAQRRAVAPQIEKGIYSFKGMKLGRADIEWLLATHENGRGPINWEDPTQRAREGLDLRGVDLSGENLRRLPLARLQGGLVEDEWTQATTEQRHIAAIHLERAVLSFSRLEGSILTHAHLQGAQLNNAHLESVDAFHTHLDGSVPTNLRFAYFDTLTMFAGAKIANEKHIGPRLIDVRWGSIDLTGIDWSSTWTLPDEHMARNPRTKDGKLKDRQDYLKHYQEATRAYHQLAQVLQQQGLNEDASRFTYRAQLMQRKVFWHQGISSFGQYLFSLLLDLLTGYGYKPIRSFITYAVVISVFTFIYFLLGPHLAWNEAVVISMTAFHGRGFFPEQFKPGDPQALVAAIEAFVGLLIEVTFIATLTQRLFGR